MKPCPQCGARGTLSVRPAIQAKPLGSHSLAGAMIKASATLVAVLSCSSCGWSVTGWLENVEMAEDGRTFTGGHFVYQDPGVSKT